MTAQQIIALVLGHDLWRHTPAAPLELGQRGDAAETWEADEVSLGDGGAPVRILVVFAVRTRPQTARPVDYEMHVRVFASWGVQALALGEDDEERVLRHLLRFTPPEEAAE